MHVDGNGLYLSVTPKGAKSGIFRYQLHGKRREMGLGSLTGRQDFYAGDDRPVWCGGR
jgi:hypothetical protein